VNVDFIGGRVRFGERLTVSFHRTLRLPEDSSTYPLPPGLGLLPVTMQSETGVDKPNFLVPLYRREALWLGFSAAAWKPNAVKVIAGGINAVSGLPDEGAGLDEQQNYVVCPDQPWLDGCNIGGGVIRQFVAMPLGQGYGLGADTARGERGGLDIIAVEPLPGRFPDAPPPPAGAVAEEFLCIGKRDTERRWHLSDYRLKLDFTWQSGQKAGSSKQFVQPGPS